MKSIRAKIVILLLCCVIITSVAVSSICVRQMSSSIRETTKDNMLLICEKNARMLNTTFENIENAVETLGHYVTGSLPSVDLLKDAASPAYAEYIAKVSQIAINHASALQSPAAVYVVFNPDFYTQEAGLFYVYEDGAPVAKPLSDFGALAQTGTDWWTMPTQAGKPMWIDGEHNGSHKNYFSYVAPMYDENGTLLGVAGMDFPYTLLHEHLAGIRVMESGYANILDRGKHVIAHPTIAEGALVGENYQGEAFGEIKKYFFQNQVNAFAQGEYNFEQALADELFTYEQDGEVRMMTLCVLQNGMTLCLSAPRTEIYAEQYEMLFQSLLIVLLILVASVGLAIVFANRLTAPLIALNKAAQQFADGDLESTVAVTSRDEIGELTQILEATRVRLRDSLNELYREAHIDTLTGTNNKAAFADAQEVLNESIKNGNASFALVLFDVNYLKITNDTFGHMAGDELLQKIAACIKTVFGSQNTYRLGGDEFAALIPTNTDENELARADECMAMITGQKLESYPDVPISCAMGVAFYRPDDRSVSDVFARADQAMYHHKVQTKKETPFWHKDLQAMRQVQIKHYLEFLSILSQSMDSYPFLLDISTNKNWFFNNADAKYPVCPAGSRTNTVEDMMNAVYPDDREALSADLQQIANGLKNEHNMDYRWVTHDGSVVWVNCHGKVICDNNGKPLLMLGRVSDTVLLPWYNSLTTLFNKEKFAQDSQNGALPPFSRLVLINIDNLSHINLKHGQAYGDRMLKLLADTLKKHFPNNVLYHMEKDYFVLLLTVQKESKIRAMIQQILEQVEEFFTLSVAVVPNDTQSHMDAENLYEHARLLLKANRSESGDAVFFFSGEDFSQTISDLDLAQELDDSVYQYNFKDYRLCFQPQIDAHTYEVVSCEALLRYTSPTKGMMSPATFIPTLERTGLILDVGLWVLETAIKQCAAWRRTRPTMRISVNVSPIQLKDENLANEILRLLEENALPADALKLEITETAELIGTAFLKTFAILRAAGVHVSIDDFGTGYANLAYLQKIHADELKIDRLFVQNLKQGSFHYALVSNIAAFAKKNGFRLCMEGVETVTELAVAELTDPDLLQGYLFDKPLTASEFEAHYVIPTAPQEWSFWSALRRERNRTHFAYFDTQALLTKINVGLWSVQFDKKEQTGKLYGDDITRKLFDFNNSWLSPSRFKYFRKNICADDAERVLQSFAAMKLADEAVQLVFKWMHPTKGEIRLQCVGELISDQNDILTFEGFLKELDN